jgi:hypothetical protein
VTTTDAMETLVEHFEGDFGFTVIFTLDEYRKGSIQFFAAEITARDLEPNSPPQYTEAGHGGALDFTEDPARAERMVSGVVKWDGCSTFYFGDAEGHVHLCGRKDVDKMAKAIQIIHHRCAEMMRAAGGYLDEVAFGS